MRIDFQVEDNTGLDIRIEIYFPAWKGLQLLARQRNTS